MKNCSRGMGRRALTVGTKKSVCGWKEEPWRRTRRPGPLYESRTGPPRRREGPTAAGRPVAGLCLCSSPWPSFWLELTGRQGSKGHSVRPVSLRLLA